MSQEKPKTKIGQLLERLQEESWQLELLITGFAIFLIVGSKEPLWSFLRGFTAYSIGTSELNFLNPLIGVLISTWIILIVNLVLHVLIRGMWISAIGLRYISDDIDHDTLNFSPRFQSFLKREIPSFDGFIEKLEKLSSVVFAFTFIIIFMVLSLGSFSILIILVSRGFDGFVQPLINENISSYLENGIEILIFIGGLVYFVDFVTLGWVKKQRWLSRVYYPVYRFFGWVTLAFLYRPLYYNLIDNKFGRKVGYLLVPYMILLAVISSIQIESFLYFPGADNSMTIDDDNYKNHNKDDQVIRSVQIQGKYIEEDFLEIYIPYQRLDDDAIQNMCPQIIPDKSVGVRFDIIIFTQDSLDVSPADSLLKCNTLINHVYLNDSLVTAIDFHFYSQPNFDEKGLLGVFNIDNLSKGMHHLKVEKAILVSEEIQWRTVAEFPFWKIE